MFPGQALGGLGHAHQVDVYHYNGDYFYNTTVRRASLRLNSSTPSLCRGYPDKAELASWHRHTRICDTADQSPRRSMVAIPNVAQISLRRASYSRHDSSAKVSSSRFHFASSRASRPAISEVIAAEIRVLMIANPERFLSGARSLTTLANASCNSSDVKSLTALPNAFSKLPRF